MLAEASGSIVVVVSVVSTGAAGVDSVLCGATLLRGAFFFGAARFAAFRADFVADFFADFFAAFLAPFFGAAFLFATFLLLLRAPAPRFATFLTLFLAFFLLDLPAFFLAFFLLAIVHLQVSPTNSRIRRIRRF